MRPSTRRCRRRRIAVADRERPDPRLVARSPRQGREGRGLIGEQIGRRIELDDPAVIEHEHAIKVGDAEQAVRDDDERRVAELAADDGLYALVRLVVCA